ncbi:MAG: DHHA1 domain-containing protein [Candidatus Nanoarchaeia archaeon]|nr:DHHA1 domain-containing protein [Candidatus Nanoarchaeia archaeon]
MLTKKQVNEIREILNNSSSPLFFFDNDPDGLCSFLLLQKFIKKGKGFPMKASLDSSEIYLRKINEFNPDCIFILDKPVISHDFFKKVQELNLPAVWIDHHEINKKDIPDFVHYYNPLFNRKKTSEPVTALCYQINNDKNLMWLAIAGCVSDRFSPDFYREFKKKYPDLATDSEEAYDIFYNSQAGKIARIFSFALKDRTTNVINMMKFLMKAGTPYEVLEDSSLNHTMHARFEQVESKYKKLLGKAIKIGKESKEILFFRYGGELSISADLSNELVYRFPKKVIAVAYVTGIKANISVRGKGVRDKVVESIKDLSGATGGGHENAAGAQMKAEDLGKFMENFEKLIITQD